MTSSGCWNLATGLGRRTEAAKLVPACGGSKVAQLASGEPWWWWCSDHHAIEPERQRAKAGAGRQVDHVVLFGEEAAQGDQRREEPRPRPETWPQVKRRQHGNRRVHAREAVRAGVQALDECEESLGSSPRRVPRPPLGRGHHWIEEETCHLEDEEQQVAHGDVGELAWRPDDEVGVEDHRVVEAAVDPDPAGAVGDQVVDGQAELAGLGPRVTLAPEIELVDADDEKHAER